MGAVSPEPYSEAELDAAVEALSDPERFRVAESAVAAAAPALQRILVEALEVGGWFSEAHEDELRKALESEDREQAAVAVRTLLAEEARIAMMVGVAVGWALREQLRAPGEDRDQD